MFICTANVLHTIPQALRDRMEVLQLAGYTEQEKIEIAKRFLAPKASKARARPTTSSFATKRFRRSSSATRARPASATSSARSRRSAARWRARSSSRARFKEDITAEKVTEHLGVPRFRPSMAEEQNEVGIATGLAWTEVGGELLVSEATLLMAGKGKLTLTGKLGDVMQESAQAAISYVRSKAAELNMPEDFHSQDRHHVHVPEGAIPKDPSAGITMATTLISALTGSRRATSR